MAKKKTKSKPKPNAKVKPKAKPKAVKPKTKAKTKPKAKTQSKPTMKSKAKNGPSTVYPPICNSFTANTGDTVIWQSLPSNGCVIESNGNWPFNIGPPITLPSPSTIMVTAGTGRYSINVKCCSGEGLKVVTVP